MALLAGVGVVAAGNKHTGLNGRCTCPDLPMALAELDQETLAWGWPA